MDSNNYVAPAPGGGFVVVRNGQQVGTFADQNAAEQAYNAAAGGGGSGGGGKTYDTPNGPRTLDQMRRELQGAGYNGSQTDADIYAAYNRTAGGGEQTRGAGGGGYDWPGLGNALINSSGRDFDLRKSHIDAQIRDIDGRLALAKSGDERQQLMADREYLLRSRDQYTGLAEALLRGATQLQRPQDWLKYAQYTNGGRDIFQSLYGSQASPAFGAPTGYSQPMGITDLLRSLGITAGTLPGSGTSRPDLVPGGPSRVQPPEGWYGKVLQGYNDASAKLGRGLTPDEWVRNWTLQTGLPADVGRRMYDLGRQYQQTYGAERADEPTQQRWLQSILSGQNTGYQSGLSVGTGRVAEGSDMARLPQGALNGYGAGAPGAATTGQTVGGGTGERQSWLMGEEPGGAINPGNYGRGVYPPGQAGGTGQDMLMGEQPGGAINPGGYGRGPYGRGQGATVGTGQEPGSTPVGNTPMAPLPHQINPAVWDSMSDTARQMVLGAAQAGRTPSGVWEPADYLRQINQARPIGRAPGSTRINWQSVMG